MLPRLGLEPPYAQLHPRLLPPLPHPITPLLGIPLLDTSLELPFSFNLLVSIPCGAYWPLPNIDNDKYIRSPFCVSHLGQGS